MQPGHISFSEVSILPASAPAALLAATKMLEDMPREKGWKHAAILDRAHFTNGDYARSSSMLDHSDFKRLFLDNTASGDEFCIGTDRLLQQWTPGNEPSLTSILMRAADHFNMSEADRKMLAVAGILGSYETDLDYHNAEHNRKVVLGALRLATASKDLSSHDIAKLLTAAAIHDFGHDGKGNGIGAEHVPYRLEKQSVILARPYFEEIGVAESDLEDIKTMIYGTDVTPLGKPDSPARRVAEGKDFPKELERLEGHENDNDKAILLKLSRMLGAADILFSSSMTMEETISQTRKFGRELGKGEMSTEEMVNFYSFFATNCVNTLDLPEITIVFGDNHKKIHANMQASVKTTAHM